jgi:hypothetical protein
VRDVHKALVGGYTRCPALNRPSCHLDGAPTQSAHEVVMVVVGIAPAIERFAVLRSTAVNLACLGQGTKLVVHRGQPHPLAPCTQLAIEVLGAPEPLEFIQNGRQRSLLPS